MPKQGCYLSEKETQKIISLLASTDLTMGEIGARMGRSTQTVASVNRRFNVRDYGGRKRLWTLRSKKMS